jgi:predicted ATPase
LFLKSISLSPGASRRAGFPFSLPLVQRFKSIELSSPVTFFVGENGSGKSTLLEGVAAATGLPVVGGQSVQKDESMEAARSLGKALKLAWSPRTHKGFFLRAEDFFNFSRSLRADSRELEAMAEDFSGRGAGLGWKMAAGTARGQREEFRRLYGDDLDARSHGESFLKLFQSRLAPGGLYLLDEPEAPLSPQRQVAFLAMLMEAASHSQFVIATHSPILMALPGAALLSFDEGAIREEKYGDLEHVRITKAFLANPESYLRHLRG